MIDLLWEEGGVLRRMSGHVSSAELDSSAIRLQSDARVDDLRYVTHDFAAVTDIDVSQDNIEFMAVRASIALAKNPRVKIAFVGSHPVVHALFDSFCNLGGSRHRCDRFDSLEAARQFVSA